MKLKNILLIALLFGSATAVQHVYAMDVAEDATEALLKPAGEIGRAHV